MGRVILKKSGQEIKYISMNIRKSIDEICHSADIRFSFFDIVKKTKRTK